MNEAATPLQRLFRILVTVGPGALWLFLFVLLPTFLVLLASFMSRGPYGELSGPWGFHNYLRLLEAPYLKAFAQSLLLGALTTLLAALLGTLVGQASGGAPLPFSLGLLGLGVLAFAAVFLAEASPLCGSPPPGGPGGSPPGSAPPGGGGGPGG